MLQKLGARLAVMAGLIGLSGCVMPDPALTYTVPDGLTAQNGATVAGTLNKTGALAPDERVYLVSVDNKQIQDTAVDSWSTPILLPPGEHVLVVEACECNSMTSSWVGSVSLAIDLQPGESYQIHATLPQSTGGFHPPETTAWVTDSKGNRVGQSATGAMNVPQQLFVPY